MGAGQNVVDESPKMPFYFSATRSGALFGTNNCTQAEIQAQKCGADSTTQAFRQTSLHSKLPQAVAELMQLDPETQNLRILR
jgi:hypothetical protein